MRAWRRRPHVHREALGVEEAAGLVPCPLTLYAMLFAMARGVPEAGVAFAAAMVGGVSLTLVMVALMATLAGGWVVAVLTRHGASFERLSRYLEAVTGAVLIMLALIELTRRL